jgi:hypothetical protein
MDDKTYFVLKMMHMIVALIFGTAFKWQEVDAPKVDLKLTLYMY